MQLAVREPHRIVQIDAEKSPRSSSVDLETRKNVAGWSGILLKERGNKLGI